MNRIITIAVLAFFTLNSLSAQQYERAVRNNLWNDGENVAAIRQDTLTISFASMNGSYEFGDYRTMSQSVSQWSAAISASTITHLDRFSMTGSFSFMDTEAKDMTGSMFIDRGFFPVDVYEFTPGRKTFQKYGMTGGVSVDMGDNWRLGALLDFKSQNVAKRKDLRYSAYRLDMKLAPSVMYINDDFGLGASFIFKRNTETISAAQIGSAENAPFAFFDEGLAFGNYQAWTGNGTHLKESGVKGLPVQQNISAGALQLSSGGIYAELYGGWLHGKIGERQTIWYRYNGPEAKASLSFRKGGNTLRSSFSWSRMSNRESVQDKVTEGGISIVKEYGSNLIYQTNRLGLDIEYEYMFDKWDGRIRTSLVDLQRMSTPMYPYVITRDLKMLSLSVDGFYRFSKFEVGASLSYYQGFATDEERVVPSGSEIVTNPFRMDEVYNDLSRIETCPALSGRLSVDWNFTGRLHLNASAECAYGIDFAETKPFRLLAQAGLCYIF